MNVSECRLFVIDDDPSVGKGLSRLLHSAGYETEVFHSAIDYLKREPFDGVGCLILDVRMPQLSGTELQLQLKQQRKGLPIIFLTAHGDIRMSVESMKRGAVDFLLKPVDEKLLLDAVQSALERHSSVHQQRLQTADARTRQDTLTPREIEVLQFILGGARNKQIAAELCISEKTVKAHRGKIMHKLNASSAAELGWICSLAKMTVNHSRKSR